MKINRCAPWSELAAMAAVLLLAVWLPAAPAAAVPAPTETGPAPEPSWGDACNCARLYTACLNAAWRQFNRCMFTAHGFVQETVCWIRLEFEVKRCEQEFNICDLLCIP